MHQEGRPEMALSSSVTFASAAKIPSPLTSLPSLAARTRLNQVPHNPSHVLPTHPAAIPVHAGEPSAALAQCPALPLQRKLAIGSANDPLEAEADSMADRVMNSSVGAGPSSTNTAPALRRKPNGDIPPIEAPSIVHEALHSPSQPLEAETRAFMEPRVGRDLSSVRIHTGPRAADSARAIDARAYTVGPDIVFASGAYEPRTHSGRRLIAHELSHTLQQTTGNEHADNGSPLGNSGGVVRRQPNPGGQQGDPFQLPPLQVPGTGITVIPGPPDPTSLAGLRLPLPASLRITNALSVNSTPSFVADIAPRGLVLTLLDGIDLSASTRPGTPPNAAPNDQNQARIRLIRPVLVFDTARQSLHGHATLSIPSDYPASLHGPTELDVEISSSELGQFQGSVGYGPLHADFSLRLHYQTDRLEQALRPAFRPEGGFAGFWESFQRVLGDTVPGIRLDTYSAALQSLVRSFQAHEIQAGDLAARTVALIASSLPPTVSAESVRTALTKFIQEITHPGFTAAATTSLFGLPLNKVNVSAPTTVPLAYPLPGAPAAFPVNYSAYGVVLAPAGAVTQTPVPAFGATGSSFNERRGISGTAAVLPTISPSAISAGQGIASDFPTYAYAEVSYVRRISSQLDMGVRVTLQVNSAQLFGPKATPSTDSGTRLGKNIQDYQTAAAQVPGTETAPPPNIGVSVFGRFNGL